MLRSVRPIFLENIFTTGKTGSANFNILVMNNFSLRIKVSAAFLVGFSRFLPVCRKIGLQIHELRIPFIKNSNLFKP